MSCRGTARAGRLVLACALVLLPIAGSSTGAPPAAVPQRLSIDYGSDLFFHETFGGNGRTCATCHDPRGEFTVSPELIEERFRLDPTHPLFRAVDSDDGQGRDFTTLRRNAVFRVTVPLNPSVSVVGHPAQRTITVWRAAPSILNVSLTAPYLQDGRAATLPEQAAGAIKDHMQPSHAPSDKELDALRLFMVSMYYPQRLASLQDTSDPVPKGPGFSIPVESDAALRGRTSFDLHCRKCHGGELLDTPSLPGLSRFQNVFVSDANVPNLPLLELTLRLPDGTPVDVETPDPGRAAITGDLRDLNAFDTPSLRGVKHTAPYFHDHSVPTLGGVVDHYNDHFQMHIGPAERDDLIAYLESL